MSLFRPKSWYVLEITYTMRITSNFRFTKVFTAKYRLYLYYIRPLAERRLYGYSS